MSKSRKRRSNFTAEQKVRILREHLLEDVPLSDVCGRHGIRPSQFYIWQKQLFEHGAQVFHRTPDRKERELKKKLLSVSGSGEWYNSPALNLWAVGTDPRVFSRTSRGQNRVGPPRSSTGRIRNLVGPGP